MYIEKINMPKLGETVVEISLIRWLIKEGDEVNALDPICEVETDKVTTEITSTAKGKVKKLLQTEGVIVPVGEGICLLECEGEKDLKADLTKSTSSPKPSSPTPDFVKKPEITKMRSEDVSLSLSPVVLRLAKEHSIDLNKIKGTGQEGRISRQDILKYINEQKTVPTESKLDPVPLDLTHNIEPQDIALPMSNLRKSIAQKMKQSQTEIPHAWLMIEANAHALLAYRNRIRRDFFFQEHIPLAPIFFFVRAVVLTLKEFPIFNSVLNKDDIILKKDINISFPMTYKEKLYMPVIHQADRLSIADIAQKVVYLLNKIKKSRLELDDVSRGTFTVNYTGSYGSISSMGMINYPQVAILQVESIKSRAVVTKHHSIAIQEIVNLCLSLDHRVIDGHIAGSFLKRIQYYIENDFEKLV